MTKTLRSFFNTGLLTICLASNALSQQQAQQDASDDSNVTFPASYFGEFNPLTVNDMLDRVPGIDLILNGGGSSRFGGGDRGLGASSQILIDGKRLAGKANEARSQLDRISADQVNFIEIIRGTSSELDVQNSGQIVNIVLLESQSRSSLATEVNATHFEDGTVEPGGSIAWSGQTGELTYLLSAQLRTGYRRTESFERSYDGDFSPNDTRDLDRTTDQENYSLNGNLTYALTPRDRIALNLLYGESDPPETLLRTITEFDTGSPVVRFERESLPATADNWEFGGDYQHNYESGDRLKFLFIINEKENQRTRERFQSTLADPEETKDLFLDTSSRYRERIVRGSYTLNLADNQGLELGIEAAQTIQDSGLRLGALTPAPGSPEFGGLTPIDFPNAFSTVEEIRYEPFAIHNWQINPRMSLESSLVAEWSEIEQTGDINNKRDFDFLKPKLDFRFDVSNSLQFRATLEKDVSQLSFADFSRASNDRDDDQDTFAGNPTLEPEESWQAEVSLDYRLPNDGGALNARFFYYDYENKIGRIDVSPSDTDLQSTNGNVGAAEAYGLITNASIRLGFLNLPTALFTANLTLQNSEFDDNPFVPYKFRFPPYDRGGFRLGYRHDIPSLRMNYGANYFSRINGNRWFFDIDNQFEFVFPTNLSAWVERVWFGGLTYRVELNNLENYETCGERRRFVGKRLDNILREVEYNCFTTGTQVAIKVRGTF